MCLFILNLLNFSFNQEQKKIVLQVLIIERQTSKHLVLIKSVS